jgi:hypothetical protein
MHFMDKVRLAGSDMNFMTGREEILASALFVGASGCMVGCGRIQCQRDQSPDEKHPEQFTGVYRKRRTGQGSQSLNALPARIGLTTGATEYQPLLS